MTDKTDQFQKALDAYEERTRDHSAVVNGFNTSPADLVAARADMDAARAELERLYRDAVEERDAALTELGCVSVERDRAIERAERAEAERDALRAEVAKLYNPPPRELECYRAEPESAPEGGSDG